MSAPKTKFLVTGATGFIGGSVLNRFLEHPRADSFHFTVLVRDPKKAEKFEKLGISAVVGSHSDAALMEKVASEADVVIATADCDDLVAATATLAGLKKKYEATGVPPIFINTSGTGVLTDDARGMFAGTVVYDDSDADQIESLAPTQIHRNVDLAIVNADAAGYVKTYIILPSAIYGIASGRLVDAGVQNPHSIQIPLLIKASIDRGRAGMVGEGKNLWPNVEIHELSNLYTLLYDAIVSNPSLGHGREGYFFGASGEHSMYDVGAAIGKALVAIGLSQSAEPTTFTQAELDKYFGGSPYLGTNSRCRSTHSFSIGWKPTKSTSNMLASIQPEVEALHAKAK